MRYLGLQPLWQNLSEGIVQEQATSGVLCICWNGNKDDVFLGYYNLPTGTWYTYPAKVASLIQDIKAVSFVPPIEPSEMAFGTL